MTTSPQSYLARFSTLFTVVCFLLTAGITQAQTHYQVVILAGQSNAVGASGATDRRNLPANLQTPQTDVLFFSNGGFNTSLNVSLSGPTDLQPGSGTGDFGFGPEVTFGRTVADDDPNVNLAIVKHAASATDLAVQWAPNTGSVYNAFVNTVNRATNNITSNGDTFEITGFLWVQGEADANREQGAAYNANLSNFIANVRGRYGADMPFFVVPLSDNQVYGANAENELVRQAQEDVAAADANTFFVNTDGPEFAINPAPDNLHYTTEGQMVLGQALANSYLAVTAGNDQPVAFEDSLTVAAGGTADTLTGGEVTLQANDTDSEDGVPAGDVLLVDAPSNGSVTVNLDGTFEYVHDGSATTSDQFTYTVNDSLGAISAPAAVSVTVTPAAVNGQMILVQEDFAGAAGSNLNGTSPTIGTGTWVSEAISFNADGSVALAGNSLAYFDIGDVINNAKGSPDGLFQLTVTLERPTGTGSRWYSIGFSQQAAPVTNRHFLDVDGIGSIILRITGELDMWAGNGFTPNGVNPSGNSNTIDGDIVVGTRTLTVQIDLRDSNGTTDFGTVTYFDSGEGEVGSFNYTNTPILANTGELGGVPTDPDFSSIVLSGNNGTSGVYSNLTLTQILSASPLLGDVNLDGAVNFLDISPFIALLSSGTFQDEADIDQNGAVNFLDISPFIQILGS